MQLALHFVKAFVFFDGNVIGKEKMTDVTKNAMHLEGPHFLHIIPSSSGFGAMKFVCHHSSNL